MGDVVPFPKKENFVDKYGSQLPKELKNSLSMAYDEVIDMLNKMPTLELWGGSKQIAQATKFNKEYRAYVFELLTALLKAKADMCELKYNLKNTSD